MSRLDACIDRLIAHRVDLERAWDSLEPTWRDAKRQSFDRVHMQVLVRSTNDTINALRASTQLVDDALRTIR